jgi:hypothetical protein
MGLLSNRVERSEIRPGDHIYTWRAVYAYSHHGTLLETSTPLRWRRCLTSRSPQYSGSQLPPGAGCADPIAQPARRIESFSASVRQ